MTLTSFLPDFFSHIYVVELNIYMPNNPGKTDAGSTAVPIAIGSFSLVKLQFFTFSLPQMTAFWLIAPIAIVQGVYAKYYGFSLESLAAVILFVRMFDAITDPLIGHLSDRHYRRVGTRKPFVVVGGLLMIVSGYFLYVPLDTSLAYFSCWFVLLYFAHTLFDIPHISWASELAISSSDKSIIYAFRSMAGYLGLVLFYLTPILPLFDSQDITPSTLKFSAIIASVLMVPFLILCVKHTPDGGLIQPQNRKNRFGSMNASNKRSDLQTFLVSIAHNRPFLIIIGSHLSFGIAFGMWSGLIFLYVDSYLGLGSQFAKMFLLALVLGIIATPFWCKLAIRLGNKVTVMLAMSLVSMSYLYTGVLKPDEVDLWELILLKTMNALGAVGLAALIPAVLSEIVDYSTWKFRRENTAMYFSAYAFVSKSNVAVGVALGLAIAGWYGFDATTTEQSSVGIQGLMLAMVWLPIGFVFIALILIALNPIDTHRHGIIRRRLDSITRRETTQSAHNLSMSDPVIKIAKTRIL